MPIMFHMAPFEPEKCLVVALDEVEVQIMV